jgi:hypothetical protein
MRGADAENGRAGKLPKLSPHWLLLAGDLEDLESAAKV